MFSGQLPDGALEFQLQQIRQQCGQGAARQAREVVDVHRIATEMRE